MNNLSMHSRRGALAAFSAFGLSCGLTSSLLAAELAPCPPRADDLWLVDTHGIGCSELGEHNVGAWQVQRADARRCWHNSHWHDFFASLQDGKKTIVVVHGNRNDRSWAIRNGMAVYDALVREAPLAEPFRLVIYAWPADKIPGPIRDVRYKTEVSNAETYRFGWWLSHFPSTVPVSMLSFSLGGRVVAGGLHLLAGGALCGKGLPTAERPAMRSVCVAPAIDHHWLSPGNCYGQAMLALDRMRVYYNSCDPVLRRYPKLDRSDKSEALGYTGHCGSLGEAAQRYCESDACKIVGKTHDLKDYLKYRCVTAEFKRYLLWDQIG